MPVAAAPTEAGGPGHEGGSSQSWGWPEVAVLALGTILLCAAPTRNSLWLDEVSGLRHVGYDFRHAIINDPQHPPLHYAYLWVWTRVFGKTDLSLRLSSIPPALGALLVGLALARRLTDRRTALWAVLLLATSPFVLLYVRMVRYFGWILLLTPLSLLALLRAEERRRPADWLLYGISMAAVAYSDYVSPTLLAIVNLWFLWKHRRDRRMLACWAGALALAAVLYAPWVRFLLARVPMVRSFEAAELHGSWKGWAVKALLPVYSLAVGETTEPWDFWVAPGGVLLFVALVVVGVRSGRREFGVRFSTLVVVGGIVGGNVLVELFSRQTPISRMSSLVIYVAPCAYLLAARGMRALRLPWRHVALAAVLLVSGYGIFNYFAGREYLNPHYSTDWRKIARTIAGQARPSDEICAYDYPLHHYYAGPGELRTDPSVADCRDEARLRAAWARSGRRIWIVRRDRGFRPFVDQQDRLIARLRAASPHQVYLGFERQSRRSVYWRSKLLGRPVSQDYVGVYCFDPPQELDDDG